MKVRIKFAKRGVMKFVGHLDIMRYFQKAIRRAGIDIVFSEGFSPHMVMSFASPLGVGLTSEGEYMDIETTGSFSSAEMKQRLNQCMADGMEILSIRKVPDTKAGKAMSLVAAADYLTFAGVFSDRLDRMADNICEFLKQKEIMILKKSKKSEREVNIRPMIYQMSLRENGIFMQLASGSNENLKPELVMEAFSSFLGVEIPDCSLSVCRLEVYAELGGENMHQFVPLEELGEEIA